MSKIRKRCVNARDGKCISSTQKGIHRVHSKVKNDLNKERNAKYRCQTCGNYTL